MPKYLTARAPLDDGEAAKIRKLAGARHAPADWIERVRIIALSWDGLGVPVIAAEIGCHPNKVRRWLHRFNASGAGGLGNLPGCGRKRRFTEAERSRGQPIRLDHQVTAHSPGLRATHRPPRDHRLLVNDHHHEPPPRTV